LGHITSSNTNLQNLDLASTSKSQPNITISTKLKLKNLDQTKPESRPRMNFIATTNRGGTYATFSKLELFYKWNPLWLYMRLWDVKRFFEIFSVLTLHRPPQISEKWGKMAHFGRFPTFSYWLVWSLNY